MICGNCGFQNAPGDEFCGSCGQFLAWTGSADAAAGAQDAAGGLATGPPPDVAALPPDVAAAPPDAPTAVFPAPIAASTVPPPPAPSVGTPPDVPPVATAAATSWAAGLQRCDVCGTANELSRAFCLNCGARLSRAGTRTGAALAVASAQEDRLRGMRTLAYGILGLLLFFGAAALAFAAFGGLSPAAPTLTATPHGTLVAVNPRASVAPQASELPPGSAQPSVIAPPSSVAPPTETPSIPTVSQAPPTLTPPSVPPATVPPAGGSVCTATAFGASQPGGWKIYRAQWSRKAQADTLALQLQSTSSTSTASADVNVLPPDQVQSTYGVPGPASGSTAIVIVFNDAVGLSGPFGSSIGYKALQEFNIYRHAGGVLVVIGANGSGCYGLASEAWTTGAGAQELIVSLER